MSETRAPRIIGKFAPCPVYRNSGNTTALDATQFSQKARKPQKSAGLLSCSLSSRVRIMRAPCPPKDTVCRIGYQVQQVSTVRFRANTKFRF